MTNKFLIFLLAHLTILLFAANAQDPLNQKVHEWYLEERFIVADKNDDALLDWQELKAFPEEFSYYLVDRHYELTDLNGDGHLSFNELFRRTHSEYMYKYNMELRQLSNLEEKYPQIQDSDLSFLKANPQIVATLFGNLVWMTDNPQIVENLYNDKEWAAENPEVVLTLHKNLRWMTSNPSQAKNLYKNRYATRQLPELLGWRADHQAFIRMHPVANKFYGLSFFPR